MAQDNQETTIFDPVVPAVSEITKKYGIEETREDAIKRLKEGKPAKGFFIVRISKDYLQKKISEEDLLSSLKKNLEISEDTAQKIFSDIKGVLIPVLRKIPEPIGKPVEKTMENISMSGKTELAEEKNIDLFPNAKLPKNSSEPTEHMPSTEEIRKKIKKPITPVKNPETIPQSKQPKGPDSYREPIE